MLALLARNITFSSLDHGFVGFLGVLQSVSDLLAAPSQKMRRASVNGFASGRSAYRSPYFFLFFPSCTSRGCAVFLGSGLGVGAGGGFDLGLSAIFILPQSPIGKRTEPFSQVYKYALLTATPNPSAGSKMEPARICLYRLELSSDGRGSAKVFAEASR